MANISITDRVNLTASVEVGDGSPLALANLKSLNFSSLPIINDFNKPINEFPLDQVELGVGLNAPSALIGGGLKQVVGGGVTGSFSIIDSKHETLFDDDPFAPSLKIHPGECWAGLSVDIGVHEKVGTSPGGFGVLVGAGQDVAFGSYLRFPATGSALPTLKDGLATLLQSFSIPFTPAEFRTIPLGIVHTAETSGSISLGASYSAPLAVNPLATLGLPLNLSLDVAPNLEASVAGSLELNGAFIVRAYRSSDTRLVMGVYKSKETALTASLTASAGIETTVENTDVVSKVLNAVVPPADLSALHLDDGQREELGRALKECVDQSISLALNACCTASLSDEAAVVYDLDLSGSDMAPTDKAIAAALHGDWSLFETLPTARRIRNIGRELRERDHKLTLNLLGLYNATSISGYLQSTTVLHDENGQISIVDKASAKSLSAGTTPYAAKSDKLRAALAQAFIATVAYGAVKGKLGVTSFTVRQSFLEYHAKAAASDLAPQILLARAVKLQVGDDWGLVLRSHGVFSQAKFYLDILYDAQSVQRLFYQDVESRQAHSAAALDRIGRDTRIALLDSLTPSSVQRRMALTDDSVWNAMAASGNPATFRSIPGLSKLSAPVVAAISADFLDIRWWSDALQSIAPKLSALLNAVDHSKSPDPLKDATFMAAHKDLERALANLTSQTHSAFGDGWPLAAMYAVAGSTGAAAPSVQMDIGWNGKFEHYQTGPQVAAGQGSA